MAGVLAIDFGTSNTVSVLRRGDRSWPLIFDGSPLLPSAVCWDPTDGLLVGRDAQRAAGVAPARFEPNPKRRIDEASLWLGEREVAVVDAISAVFRRVAAEGMRVDGGPPDRAVLTHPAAWAGQRMGVLADAATRAGLGRVEFVAEPVAAAAYFVSVLAKQVAVHRCLVVYDFGGGTFDVAVVARAADGFSVLAADGLADVGGVDLDALVVGHVRAATATGDAAEWSRIDWPHSTADRRARRMLWDDARAAKEQLSRHPSAALHVPVLEYDHTVTREEFERLATPVLDRTVALTLTTLRSARIGPESVAGLFLVGGSSRVPLAASMLHRALRIAPTVIEQPEMVVAEGALLAAGPPPTTRSDAGPTAERPAAPTAAPGPPPTPTAAPGPTAPTSTATPPIWWNAGDLSPRRRASPLLRVIGLASIGIGVPAALGRIVDLTYGVMHESWLTLPMLAPNIAVAVMDLVVAVVAGIMLQGSGRLPWIGGGLLIGRAIINLRTVPQSLDLWQVGGYLGAWGSIRVGILQALVFAVLAALNVLALRRIRPAPACPRSSPRLAAGITVLTAFGSISYVVAYFAVLGDPPWETAFQWTWLAGTGTAMVAYAMFGRPVAVAPGLLVAAATSVAPFIVLLIAGTGPADQTGLRVGGSILVMTYLATLPLAVAVLRSRGERAVAR